MTVASHIKLLSLVTFIVFLSHLFGVLLILPLISACAKERKPLFRNAASQLLVLCSEGEKIVLFFFFFFLFDLKLVRDHIYFIPRTVII